MNVAAVWSFVRLKACMDDCNDARRCIERRVRVRLDRRVKRFCACVSASVRNYNIFTRGVAKTILQERVRNEI